MWFHLFGFGIGERQKRLELLDDGLRAVGVHPSVVDEGIKLAILKLKKQALAAAGAKSGTAGEETLLHDCAWLFGYCYLGPKDFEEAHGAELAEAWEARLGAAEHNLASGDAEVALLALTSGFADDEIAARFDVEVEES